MRILLKCLVQHGSPFFSDQWSPYSLSYLVLIQNISFCCSCCWSKLRHRAADLFKGASLINRQRASARDRLIFHHIFNWTNLSSKKQIDLLELKWLFSRFAIEEMCFDSISLEKETNEFGSKSETRVQTIWRLWNNDTISNIHEAILWSIIFGIENGQTLAKV